jgi:transitional endoplasmic reticulum ATPase
MVELTVADVDLSDRSWGVAGLAAATMERLDVEAGDPIAVEGGRTTTALVSGEYTDTDEAVVRLDETTRKNAAVGLNEPVDVTPAEVSVADRIAAAPSQSLKIRGGGSSVKRALDGHPVREGDSVPVALFGGSLTIEFAITDTTPEGPVVVGEDTTLEVLEETASGADLRDRPSPTVTYDDVGGLHTQIDRLRDVVELPLRHPRLFQRLGTTPQTGVLLYGPTGTGKTLLVRALANESDAHFVPVSSPSVMGRGASDTEEFFEDVLTEARENAPSLVFFDEVDAIAPDRDDATSTERRVVAQLLALLDELADEPDVVVVGATNRLETIDEAVRRGGRFDREIEVGVPGRDDREEILEILARPMPLDGVDLGAVADRTHGFVGADLATLAGEAALAAIRRTGETVDLDAEGVPLEVADDVRVTQRDFEAGLRAVEPSAMREVFVEVPNVTYDDVGGLREAKRELIRAAEWPLKYPELFHRLRAEPPRGVLMYGPPGTGKTLLAKAVANASDVNFISVKGPEVLNKYVGESERAVRDIFEKARQNAPSIVFFDEIDSITTERGESNDTGAAERVVSQLLTEIDGIDELENVLVVAATNRPDMVDRALMRPGRFEKVVEVPVPDAEARQEIFEVHTRSVPTKELDYGDLAAATEGYTGSDIEAVVREASLLAIEEFLYERSQGERERSAEDLFVRSRHVERALETVGPSLTADTREYYDGIAEELRGD